MSESCFHCGQDCDENPIRFNDKNFCCSGCRGVYEIINHHSLGNFYELNSQAGTRPSESDVQFDYLDEKEIFEKVVDFSEGELSIVRFHIPVIHCTSCIWLLENLRKINPAVKKSVIYYSEKEVQITFESQELSLKELAIFLTELGYRPKISLNDLERKKVNSNENRSLVLKLVIAGFCFGNIMLFTIPDYMQSNDGNFNNYFPFFSKLILLLSLPVVFYSAQPYLISAWQGLKNRFINIDFPIAIGILSLFLRSVYELTQGLSLGYFDSLAGLVFFMLIGRYFQSKTYKSLSFDRNYKSFFPIAITRLREGKAEQVPLCDIQMGNRLEIRNGEVIPADSILIKGFGQIDNSFITGESDLIEKQSGDRIFAGAKQMGGIIELETIKSVDQSYLTQLWQQDSSQNNKSRFHTLIDTVSQYFSIAILIIAIACAVVWYFIDPSQIFLVTTAVLIVACPCALGLSGPFILGHTLRIFGKKGFYAKNVETIEQMAKIDHLVFDKTGTLTNNKQRKISYEGAELSLEEKKWVKSLLNSSNHPLSKLLTQEFKNTEILPIKNFEEMPGLGIVGEVNNTSIKLGNRKFLDLNSSDDPSTEVNICIDGDFLGRYTFESKLRSNISSFAKSSAYEISVLSGDGKKDAVMINRSLPNASEVLFEQSPEDKKIFIAKKQKIGKKLMMFGDGLNDAAALKQCDVGVALADDMNAFYPASDAILSADSMQNTFQFLKFSRLIKKMIGVAIFISLAYNCVGLYFAATGQLEPIIAAILMPLSSITVVLFSTLSTWWLEQRLF